MAKPKKSKKIKKRFGRDALDWQETSQSDGRDRGRRSRGHPQGPAQVSRECASPKHGGITAVTGMQRDAEKEMEFAWRLRTAGLGAAVSKYGLQRGGSGRADLGSSADATWIEWSKLAHDRRILVAAVVDCIAEPRTLAEIERTHRMRRGQAFGNYVLALDLWCEVRGWIRGPRMDGPPHLAAEGVAR